MPKPSQRRDGANPTLFSICLPCAKWRAISTMPGRFEHEHPRDRLFRPISNSAALKINGPLDLKVQKLAKSRSCLSLVQ